MIFTEPPQDGVGEKETAGRQYELAIHDVFHSVHCFHSQHTYPGTKRRSPAVNDG
jgi:hypothetical protein